MTAATENWYNPYMLIKGQAFFLIQQWGGVGWGAMWLCAQGSYWDLFVGAQGGVPSSRWGEFPSWASSVSCVGFAWLPFISTVDNVSSLVQQQGLQLVG